MPPSQQRREKKAALYVNEFFILKQPSGLEIIGVNPLKVAYLALEEKELHRMERESQFRRV